MLKTLGSRYSVFVLLLVSLGVLWLKRDVCTLDTATAWVQHLGSRGPFMFAGLYGFAPTLHLQGAVPTMPGEALCGTILSMLLTLMGTTIGVMVACLLGRALLSGWRMFWGASVWSPGSMQTTGASQVE